MALNQLNRLPEAETAFADLTQEFPELPEPYNNLAVVRAAQGKLDQARTALEDAIRAVPDYALAHENLGDIHAQLAARSYRNAQKLEPANKTVAPKLKLVSQVPRPRPARRSADPSRQPARTGSADAPSTSINFRSPQRCPGSRSRNRSSPRSSPRSPAP